MQNRYAWSFFAGWLVTALPAFAAPPSPEVLADRREEQINRDFDRAEYADAYLISLTTRILTQASVTRPLAIRVRALRADLPVVLCLPNGAAYVTTGVLARLQNESQLAALLATEIADAMSTNASEEAQISRDRHRNNFPKMLALIATGGIAAIPMRKHEDKTRDQKVAALKLETDRVGLEWARSAGFDIAQAPLAARRLRAVLESEHRVDEKKAYVLEDLDERALALALALERMPPGAAPLPDPAEPFHAVSRRASLDMIRADLVSARRGPALPVIERLEREDGPHAATTCLRADFVRGVDVGSRVSDSLLAAYESCAASPGVAPAYLRDLGYLYRDRGDKAGAVRSFEKYLALDPLAPDAPIIRGQVDELHGPY